MLLLTLSLGPSTALHAARNFNGTSDYIKVADQSALDITGSWTAALWIKTTGTPGATADVLRKNSAYIPLQFVSSTSQGRCVRWSGGAHNTDGFPWSDLSNGAWHAYVCSYSTTSGMNIYVDGAAVVTDSGVTGSNDTSANALCIGAACESGDTENFSGTVAEVAVWNVVLNTNEISALAHGTPPSKIRRGNLVGYWACYGAGSPEPDLSGNKNNGTLTGTTAANHAPVGK